MEESVNVLEDYRKAFGKELPATAGIAVMSDSDNTKTSAEAYLDFIEVEKANKLWSKKMRINDFIKNLGMAANLPKMNYWKCWVILLTAMSPTG